ncbi:hypothetical protein [Marinobacter similis]|uniref:hypothetical protein n=1 Tax=Marinobacter similis TaxID=1420916 RepID=UPI000AD05139|nr:hypothetical protein [Marinobacter similis]
MIGSINSGNSFTPQSGNNSPIRERSDVARAPAASPEKTPESARRDLADARTGTLVERTSGESLERRIELAEPPKIPGWNVSEPTTCRCQPPRRCLPSLWSQPQGKNRVTISPWPALIFWSDD